jgi:endonuclease YncB( thermonuclease family)
LLKSSIAHFCIERDKLKNIIGLLAFLASLGATGCSTAKLDPNEYYDEGYYGYGHVEAVRDDVFVRVQDAPTYQDLEIDNVISVYDGDTIRVDLKGDNIPDVFGKNIGIRFDGIDTPEIRGSSRRLTRIAKKAKEYTVQALINAKEIKLANVQRGKYFRILATVMVDGESLNEKLIQEELAVYYDGGSKLGLWDKRYKRNRKKEE